MPLYGGSSGAAAPSHGMLDAASKWYGPRINSAIAMTVVDQMSLYPIHIARACTVDRLAVNSNTTIGAATRTIRLGLYADNNGVPGALLGSGSYAGGGAAYNLDEVTVSIPVSAGRHWIGLVQNGTGAARDFTSGTYINEDCPVNGPVNSPVSRILRSDGITGALPNPPVIDWQIIDSPQVFLRRAA